MWVVFESSSDRMVLERFGSVQIFRPRLSTEIELRISAERHLRSKYNLGKYTDKQTINEILHHQFSFFTGLLDQILPSIASIDFLEFVLFQYDESAKVETLYKSNQLNADENERWAELGPKFRRAAKISSREDCVAVARRGPQRTRRRPSHYA